jgi:hypothetical protein
MSRPFQIEMNYLSQGGFAPRYYSETYPSYGNKNQAGAMLNIDMTNAGVITQGPGLSTLTAGTEAGAITTLVKGATDFAVTADVAYGVGGAKLQKFSSTAVTNAGAWPHTIDKAAVTAEDGEDVEVFQGALYYTYNHSGTVGDIGKFDLNATFDDDWGSTVPSGFGALVGGVPHPLKAGGNDTMAFGNGRYVGLFDGTTYQTQALDLPSNFIVVSIKWNNDRWWITANYQNLTGTNKNKASIFVWDGTTNSWELEIKLDGTAGGSHVKSGVLFQFYQDVSSSGGYKLAYVSGSNVTDVANYTGSLPAYYQITDYKDFIIWNSDGLIFAWGSGDKDLPVRLFQIADGGFTTVGCVVTPFGTPIIASTQSTSFKLAKFSGYDVTSSWKSLMFDLTGKEIQEPAKIDCVRINFDVLTSGARVDWSLVNTKGQTIYSDIISFTKLGAITSCFYPLNGKVIENLRLQLDYTNGSPSATVGIRNIKLYGRS